MSTSATSPFCRRILKATVTAGRRGRTRSEGFIVLHKIGSVNHADELALLSISSYYLPRQEAYQPPEMRLGSY
ncbi:hypothetical protein CCUS01_00027 [Colletotrichum cuscutae]|uniref:Uncharacterized protein n=1 Tax=Colletotrichum cuscutae TaxID=1209917 RepID=A0AAJ0DQG8_9PEZI|nr:hypothetical protein CCUS01_00027 [Colletotrichum cuscutae]